MSMEAQPMKVAICARVSDDFRLVSGSFVEPFLCFETESWSDEFRHQRRVSPVAQATTVAM
jgi:hypothetical protein